MRRRSHRRRADAGRSSAHADEAGALQVVTLLRTCDCNRRVVHLHPRKYDATLRWQARSRTTHATHAARGSLRPHRQQIECAYVGQGIVVVRSYMHKHTNPAHRVPSTGAPHPSPAISQISPLRQLVQIVTSAPAAPWRKFPCRLHKLGHALGLFRNCFGWFIWLCRQRWRATVRADIVSAPQSRDVVVSRALT